MLRNLALLATALSAFGSVPVVFHQPPHPPKQFHEATFQLGWDIDMSPYSGGEDVLFAHRCIERTEGWLIARGPVSYSKSAQARFWRLSELFLGYLPLNFLAVVVQHEIFGHGYRLRDIGRSRAKVRGYSFSTPPPYGPGGGATNYTISQKFTTTDESSTAMAGVESTAILALLAKLKWLQAGKINPRQTALYLLGQYDLILYIGSLKALDDHELDGHDINTYVEAVNQTYTASKLKKGRLRSLSWINLADPFTYYSFWAWIHYVSSGKETSIPMIPLFGAGYLFNARLGLTPFGPEYFVENYISFKKKRPFYFYLKSGWNGKNSYYGLGFFAPEIWNLGDWYFGARFDGWRQPKLLLQNGSENIFDLDFDSQPNVQNPLYPYSEQHQMRIGASGTILINYKYGKTGLEAEMGYKANGFVPGESLKAAPITRLYFTLFF